MLLLLGSISAGFARGLDAVPTWDRPPFEVSVSHVPEGFTPAAKNGDRWLYFLPVVESPESDHEGTKEHEGARKSEMRWTPELPFPPDLTARVAAGSPVRLALVLDHSASLRAQIQEVKAAAASLVEALSPGDEVGLVLFGSRVDGSLELTPETDLALAELESVKPQGFTALFDALWEGLRLLQETEGDRALVVFTDGRDNLSQRSAEELLALMREMRLPVFAIGFGPEADRDLLGQLAETSGGGAYFPMAVEELRPTYQQLLADLRQELRERATYQVPRPTQGPCWHLQIALSPEERESEKPRFSEVVRHFWGTGEPPLVIPWDGRNDRGKLVADGRYGYRLEVVDSQGRAVVTPEQFLYVGGRYGYPETPVPAPDRERPSPLPRRYVGQAARPEFVDLEVYADRPILPADGHSAAKVRVMAKNRYGDDLEGPRYVYFLTDRGQLLGPDGAGNVVRVPFRGRSAQVEWQSDTQPGRVALQILFASTVRTLEVLWTGEEWRVTSDG